MRLGIGLLCAAAACCSPSTLPTAPVPRAVSPSPSASASAAPKPSAPPPLLSSLPALDALASRAPSLAPGMREVARGELASAASSDNAAGVAPLVQAAATDTCARVALVAAPQVHAWLTDARGTVLADVPSAEDTSIAPRGPVCVRQGSDITLHLEASAADKASGAWVARFVAWASP
jgi:hypothetical protein